MDFVTPRVAPFGLRYAWLALDAAAMQAPWTEPPRIIELSSRRARDVPRPTRQHVTLPSDAAIIKPSSDGVIAYHPLALNGTAHRT